MVKSQYPPGFREFSTVSTGLTTTYNRGREGWTQPLKGEKTTLRVASPLFLISLGMDIPKEPPKTKRPKSLHVGVNPLTLNPYYLEFLEMN